MVFITGDLHGEYARFSDPAVRRLKKGDTLIVCGDFGFLWKGGKKEEALLKKIGNKPYTVLFLDGRHENYDLLNAYPVTEWNGGRVQVLCGTLIHLLRGERYTIEGETYFTFGGGESPDHDMRAEAGAWWEAEMPTPAEMRHGLETLMQADKKVDYILTHEPSGKCRGLLESRGARLNGLNIYFNQIEEHVAYKRWFFGCQHLDKTLSRRHRAVFRDVVPIREEEKRKRDRPSKG